MKGETYRQQPIDGRLRKLRPHQSEVRAADSFPEGKPPYMRRGGFHIRPGVGGAAPCNNAKMT